MKWVFYTISFLFFVFKSLGQNSDNTADSKSPSVIFKNFTGFRERIQRVDNKVRWAYTITGKEYNIHILPLDYDGLIFGKKGMSNLIANEIKKNADFFKTNVDGLPYPNTVAYRALKLNDTISITNVIYVFPANKDTSYYCIDMNTFFERDSILEKDIIHSIFFYGIYDSIFRSP